VKELNRKDTLFQVCQSKESRKIRAAKSLKGDDDLEVPAVEKATKKRRNRSTAAEGPARKKTAR